MPDFDARNYGYRKLADLVSTFSGLETARIPVGESGKDSKIMIKIK